MRLYGDIALIAPDMFVGCFYWPTGACVLQRRYLSIAVYLLASLIGIWAFAAPFLNTNLLPGELQAGGILAPILLVILVGLCYLALLHEAHGPAASATIVALLGVLVALNAALRFAETVVPGPGGFTPMFLLIILTGYVFGARIGFLMGALSMMVSALITGGVGPWLPYQMWAAGWVGLSARGVLPLAKLARIDTRAGEIVLLALFAGCWGFGYGAIMNIWFWPYVIGDASSGWVPGLSLFEGASRYFSFYLLTSFGWDVFAAIGNITLITVFGMPVLRALRRFEGRVRWRRVQNVEALKR
jgi:energy-coupling factor transport system substrate-specific component